MERVDMWGVCRVIDGINCPEFWFDDENPVVGMNMARDVAMEMSDNEIEGHFTVIRDCDSLVIAHYHAGLEALVIGTRVPILVFPEHHPPVR